MRDGFTKSVVIPFHDGVFSIKTLESTLLVGLLFCQHCFFSYSLLPFPQKDGEYYFCFRADFLHLSAVKTSCFCNLPVEKSFAPEQMSSWLKCLILLLSFVMSKNNTVNRYIKSNNLSPHPLPISFRKLSHVDSLVSVFAHLSSGCVYACKLL
jgi:hypothetical protein